MSLLAASKRWVTGGASRVGVFNVISRSSWRRRRLLILCYHGVSQLDEHLCSEVYVSPGHLRRRFERLAELGCSVVSLDEGLRSLKSGDLPPMAVCLTFDDGFVDFHRHAYPLLREFQYPATIYVATYYCEFQRPVFDPIITYLLWRSKGKSVDLGGLLKAEVPSRIPIDADERMALQQKILGLATARRWSAAEKDDLARRLADRLGIDYDEILGNRLYHLMTPRELANLDPSLVDVQLHTHRHRPPLERDLLRREISDNRKSLRSALDTDRRFEHFCYPSGIYARQLEPWLIESQIESATTCDPGIVGPGTPMRLLPRFIDTEGVSDVIFDGWVAGFCAWLPQRSSNRQDHTSKLGKAVA